MPLMPRSLTVGEPGYDVAAYKAQIAGRGESVWSENGLRFAHFEEAREYALDLLGRWLGADLARVVPVETPNRETVDLDDPQIVANFR